MSPRQIDRTWPRRSARRGGILAGAPALILASLLSAAEPGAGESTGSAEFTRSILPILQEYCYDCHADGANKGSVSFDEFKSDQAVLESTDLWLKALKNLRAGIMPPSRKPQPSDEQRALVERWIKGAVFQTDPHDLDPGRVTVRRLNRVEYRNTIRDLLGVEFNTDGEFPPDDTGHGFDNIGDVLTLPPMLLEKYLAAAKTIVSRAVPAVPWVPAEKVVPGRQFRSKDEEGSGQTNRTARSNSGISLSYYQASEVSHTLKVDTAGRHQIVLNLTANERFVDNQFDYNKCKVIFRADGEELMSRELTREGNRPFHFEFERDWAAGEHQLVLEVQPLTPDQKQVRSLTVRIDAVTIRGPLEKEHWVRPKNHDRFFPGETPTDAAGRRDQARRLLQPFARKAWRRPVDEETIGRLVTLAEITYSQPGKTFEEGIGQAMVATLASPRFLFREEGVATGDGKERYPLIDEYALASRLSYFLWSSMPDDDLFQLAAKQQLRPNLEAQLRRMMADSRFDGFIANFTGQWLQTRDIETVPIEARQVLARETAPDPDFEKRRQRFRQLRDKAEAELSPEEKKELAELRAVVTRRFGTPLRAELNGELRRAMRQETEQTVAYVIRQDRSVLELIDGDYTFLNERLAKHYGLTNLNVTGEEMRRVTLPPDSPRGGILTQGSILAVTSNPTRTSPVKRGVFMLDNLLGTPPPPPPPDIPSLEDAAKDIKDRTLSLRETLALHREQPLCSSCHNRMDPLGLALENFNAMGMWRDKERDLPIDATGQLLSGESFTNVIQLKQILASRHAIEFYHTLTEKMLTYALGRGLDFHDVETVDRIVDRIVKADGRPSALFAGIVESAPFQKTRLADPLKKPSTLKSVEQRADARR